MEVKQSSEGSLSVSLFLIIVAFLFLCNPSSSFAQGVEVFEKLGFSGGHIHDIAIDPSNPDKMFAGVYMSDGLYMTLDGGISWQAVERNGDPEMMGEDDFKNHANFAVKIAPNKSNIVWVAHNYWVEKSEDGGQTWTHIWNSAMQRDCANCGGSGDDFRFCMSLAIDPSNPDIVYVGTAGPGNTYINGAIYKTVDGGITWTKLNSNITDPNGDPESDFNYPVIGLAIDPINTDYIWAGTSDLKYGPWFGSLYRTNDGGQSWKERTQIGTTWYDIALLPHGPREESVVFMATAYGVLRDVYDSSADANFISRSWSLGGSWGSENEVVDLALDPQNPQTIYATWLTPWGWGGVGVGDGVGKVGRSADGGLTWEKYPHDYSFSTLAIHPTDSNIIVAGEFNEGIYKSEDHGQTWSPYKNGITTIVYDVAINPDDSGHILAASFAGLYERKGGGPWSLLLSWSSRSVLFHPTLNNTIYSGLEGSLARTSDSGLSWGYAYIPGPDGYGYNFVSDIAIDAPTGTMYISVNGFGDEYGEVYKSTDGGASFFSVLSTDDLLTQGEITEEYPFNVVAIDPSNELHIFAGGGNFFAPKILGDLWESKDGGGIWTKTSLQGVIINALLIDPQNPDIMYAGAGYSGGTDIPLYKSTDGGATWTQSFEGIPGSPAWNVVTDLAFYSQDSHIIYASTYHQGIFVSNQAGHWLSLGVPEYDVYAIATSSLYAASDRGLLQLTGTGVIAGKITDALSKATIDNATVCNGFGVKTASIDGEYIMVSPAGFSSLAVVADGYGTETILDRPISGGDVTWIDFSMQGGISNPSAICGIGTNIDIDTNTDIDTYSGATNIDIDTYSGTGGGKACFIATAAYGSPMSKKVMILRKFRDKYLLPYDFGRKLINFYYRTGEPIADYIDFHPWLKSPVRVVLYPAIGFAWVMLSTTIFGKSLIGVCFLTGVVCVVRRLSSDHEK